MLVFPPQVSRYEPKFKLHAVIILLLALIGPVTPAHSAKARYHVIIDTDAALDDLRAICLFLASPEFEVLAITTSDGVMNPQQGLKKVKSLLESFGHQGIPNGAGRVVKDTIPPWQAFNRKIQWGEEEEIEINKEISAVDSILSALELEEEPVLFICLGGLTNLAQALETEPQIQGKIERIVWYNDSIDPSSGTNYDFDESAARTVFSSSLTVEAVSNSGADNPVLSPEFLESIRALNSPYALKIATTHQDGEVILRIKTRHLEFWDDLLPIYLLHSGLFSSRSSKKAGHHKFIQILDWEGVKAEYLEMLTSRDRVASEVFEGFPDDPELFVDDIRPYMKNIIQKHGKEEWRIGVLTNELHGHLGIYAIVGAKMGLRARQYFHIGIDDISIISYAGSTPPMSCMNDGLQVSTGGTVGHGLISVYPGPAFQPKAAFTFKGRTVCFRLKDRYWNIIRNDIEKGINLYGLNTEGYWKYVRKLALDYWLEWNRLEIFVIDQLL